MHPPIGWCTFRLRLRTLKEVVFPQWVTWSWSTHVAGCHCHIGATQDRTSWQCGWLGWCKWWKVWGQGVSPEGDAVLEASCIWCLAVNSHGLWPAAEVWIHPAQGQTGQPHTLLQASQQDVLVKGVKGRREVQKNQEHSAALVSRPQKIILHLDQGSLCAVVAAIGWLVLLMQSHAPLCDWWAGQPPPSPGPWRQMLDWRPACSCAAPLDPVWISSRVVSPGQSWKQQEKCQNPGICSLSRWWWAQDYPGIWGAMLVEGWDNRTLLGKHWQSWILPIQWSVWMLTGLECLPVIMKCPGHLQ